MFAHAHNRRMAPHALEMMGLRAPEQDITSGHFATTLADR